MRRVVLAVALGLVLPGGARAQAPSERDVLAEIEGFDQGLAALGEEEARGRALADDAARAKEMHAGAAARAAAEEAAHREATTAAVRELYRLERGGFLAFLAGADNLGDLVRRGRYLVDLVRRDQGRVERYAALAEEGARAAAASAAADEAAAAARASLEERRAALVAGRDRRVALLAEIRRERGLAARASMQVSQARQAFDASLAPAAPAAAAPSLSGPGVDSAGFRALEGRLPRPVQGAIVRGFGAYSDPATGQRANNTGLDFAAAFGTPFRAVAPGVVARSGYVRGYGQLVMVQHGAYATLYAHANGLRVAQGQSVSTGDVLGLVGNTGLAETSDCRLHFEIRYNGTPQDPARWLQR